MILVDSSVWIDWFRGRPTRQTEVLDGLLDTEPLAIGDLILLEVLQGFAGDRDFNAARRMLTRLEPVALGDQATAVQAARFHRALRARGVTVRKTVGTIIATRCIVDGLVLLHADRDFDPFERHLGLRVLH